MEKQNVLHSQELINLIKHIESMMNSPQAIPVVIKSQQRTIDKLRIRLKSVLIIESLNKPPHA
jgi:hypothetical protein